MKKLLILALAAIFCTKAAAETTLEACRQAALDNYPEIRKLDIIHATRECNIKNASMTWLPQIQIGGQFSWVNNVNNIDDLFANAGSAYAGTINYVKDNILNLESERQLHYMAGVSVTQNIWDGGAAGLRKKAAEYEAETKEAQVNVNLFAVEEQVDQVYFSILLLEQRLEQATGMISVLNDNFAKLQNLYNEGFAKETDLSQMEVEILAAEQNLEEIKSGIKTFRISLSLLTGCNMADEKLIIPNEPGSNTGFIRPEYSLLESQKKILGLHERKLDVELMPKLGLFADAGYGYPNRNIFRNLIDHRPIMDIQAGIKLGFNFSPLYTRKRDKIEIQNQMDYLDIQKEILDFKFDLENRQLTEESEKISRSLERDKRILELRSRLRNAAEKRLDEGDIDLTELLGNINLENDAALQLSIHRLTYLKTLHSKSKTGF